MTAPVLFTIVTSTNPPLLTKTLGVNADGSLLKISGGNLREGSMQRAAAADLNVLSAQLDRLASNQAVSWGVTERAEGPVVAKYLKAQRLDAIARSREFFRYANGPGVMMLDHDEMLPGAGGVTDPTHLRAMLIMACPALAGASLLVRPSASAGVNTGNGRVLSPLTRWRLYLLVTNAADIPKAGERLRILLWAAGFGWFGVSRAGQRLPRTILDTGVWLPERLDFAAAPVLHPGVVRPRVEPALFGDPAARFDLAQITVSDAQRAAAAKNRTGARNLVKEQAAATRRAWLDVEAPRAVERTGVTLEKARAVLERATDRSELEGTFVLFAQDGTTVTVDELCTEVDRYHEARFHDPLEPTYNNDSRIAVARLKSGDPVIYSHAHGGNTYKLFPDFARVFAQPGAPVAAQPPLLPLPPPPFVLMAPPPPALIGPDAPAGSPAVAAPPLAPVGTTSALPPPPPPSRVATVGSSLTFLAAAQGRIDATIENVFDALQSAESGLRIAEDSFQVKTMISGPDGKWREFLDSDYGHLRAEFGRRGFKPIPAEIMKTAVLMVAERNRFDSAIEWANSLHWDGVPRVDVALPKYYSTPDTPYTRAVGAYLFTAAAGRVVEPGCQADMAIVFTGLQGSLKTSAVRSLSPDPQFFAEIDLHKLGRKDEDLARTIRGALIGELAELRGLAGRDQESIKAFISRRVERWTPKFKEFTTTYPRRLLLIGTTNEAEFLDDATGERRWLPVKVGRVDLAALQRDCPQLWAEGLHRFRASGIAWRAAEDLARAEHAAHKVTDPWAESVAKWLDELPNPQLGEERSPLPRGVGRVTLEQIARGALGMAIRDVGAREARRIGKILRNLGYESGQHWIDGRNLKAWARLAAPIPTRGHRG